MTGFESSKETHYTSSIIVLSILFLMWGLITVLSGFLIPELMNAFELNHSQTILISMTFFGTYFFVSFPAGKLIDKVGYKNGIIAGVIISAIGCLLFYIAGEKVSYALSFVSLFLLASGVTILQVAANPYVVLMGMRGKGAQRLTLVQAFNSLGTVLATLFASKLIIANPSLQFLEPEAYRTASANLVQVPYLIMGGILLLLAAIISFSKLPRIITAGVQPLIKESMPARKLVLQFPHVALGAIAIFAYVGAEVSIFQFLMAKLNSIDASDNMMIKLYWGGMMVGRFAGAALLSRISPRKLITISSLAASALVLTFIILVPKESNADWNTALWVITSVGLFNSVLFPCIFTMAMDGLGKFSEEASSVLVMSIVGGAVLPFFVFNMITENPASIKTAFIIPLLAYLYIAFFGFRGSRYEKQTNFY
jgi:MFS transporter, FHS family, L-fucose permease